MTPAPLPAAGPALDQGTANFFLSPGQQSVTCIPDPSMSQVPVSCSANATPVGYLIAPTPEPGGFVLLAFGAISLTLYRRGSVRGAERNTKL